MTAAKVEQAYQDLYQQWDTQNPDPALAPDPRVALQRLHPDNMTAGEEAYIGVPTTEENIAFHDMQEQLKDPSVLEVPAPTWRDKVRYAGRALLNRTSISYEQSVAKSNLRWQKARTTLARQIVGQEVNSRPPRHA